MVSKNRKHSPMSPLMIHGSKHRITIPFTGINDSFFSPQLREVEKNHKSIKGKATVTYSEDTNKNSSKNATQPHLTNEGISHHKDVFQVHVEVVKNVQRELGWVWV